MHFTFVMIRDAIAEFCLGVGKSRFLREVAIEADTHAVWTSFESGVFASVIQRANDPEIRGKSAREVVTYLSDLWFTAFSTLFYQISLELKPDKRLSTGLARNSLPQLPNPTEYLEETLSQMPPLMGERALILIMDEAQAMGSPPPDLKERHLTIAELIDSVPKVYLVSISNNAIYCHL